MLSFHEYVKLRETAGDSWGAPPSAPAQLMVGPNAPLAGNTTGSKPPDAAEQYGKPKRPKKPRREIRASPFDDEDLIKRNMERAKELGVDP